MSFVSLCLEILTTGQMVTAGNGNSVTGTAEDMMEVITGLSCHFSKILDTVTTPKITEQMTTTTQRILEKKPSFLITLKGGSYRQHQNRQFIQGFSSSSEGTFENTYLSITGLPVSVVYLRPWMVVLSLYSLTVLKDMLAQGVEQCRSGLDIRKRLFMTKGSTQKRSKAINQTYLTEWND